MLLGHGFFHTTDVTPQGDSNLLLELVFPHWLYGEQSATRILIKVTQWQLKPKWAESQPRVARYFMNTTLVFRIQRCMFSLNQLESGLNAAFIFLIPRDITHVLRYEVWKKRKEKTSNFLLPKQTKDSVLWCVGSLSKCDLLNEILINDDPTVQGNNSSHHCF